MRQRCNNPNHDSYQWYGGQGIKVCDRWGTFANFLVDIGERPEGMTLDRIDRDGDYEPGNVRWATAKEQRANQTQPPPELSREYGRRGGLAKAANRKADFLVSHASQTAE